MNACFYLAIAHLPLGTVGAIEFLGPIALASLGARTRRNIAALVLAVAGGVALHLEDEVRPGKPARNTAAVSEGGIEAQKQQQSIDTRRKCLV